MVKFSATLLKFDEQGEKTGWTYISVPKEIAEQLKPGNKKSFRVKGKLDNYAIKSVALIPIGNSDFIMAVNVVMRKAIGKRKGATVVVSISLDADEIELNDELITCLLDEPKAVEFFNTLAKGHQRYFSKWIDDAKTVETKAKRIALAVSALARNLGFPEMMREDKAKRNINL